MKIVFYSTNSNLYNCEDFETKTIPSCASRWDLLAEEYSKHEFYILTQLPGMFMLDLQKKSVLKSKNVQYIISKKESAEEIAEEIISIQPDSVIASTFYVTPYDWLPVKDAMIADILRGKNINVISNPTSTCLTCFDKFRTSQFLKSHNFKVPNSVYVHHELFWCERGHKEVKVNVYKEYVLSEIQKLHYPVIIKDTVGLSSCKMEVLPTYKSARAFLTSHKNSSDKIVEEYVEGLQFGCEIHGVNGKHEVLPPFIFSVNKYGITSPKQSVKLGPVTDEKFHIDELKKELTRLAEEMCFNGIAQVDLVFSNNTWYIIEINPRLSGMSELYAASLNKSLYKMILELALAKQNESSELKCVCNFKLPLISEDKMNELYKLPFIKYINQINNISAKQLRERGYCEIIFGGTSSFKELQDQLDLIAQKFPEIIEPVFLQNAKELFNKI